MARLMNIDRMHANVVAYGTDADGTAIDDLFRQGVGWIELIKTVRQIHHVSIFEAERRVLAHPGWRRWCNLRISIEPQCRKLAWSHMRYNGPDSLIEREGERFRVREEE
jgi:hypothetical protein